MLDLQSCENYCEFWMKKKMFVVGEFVGFIVPLDEYIYVTSCYVNAIELSLVSFTAQVFNGRKGFAPDRCGGWSANNSRCGK